MQRFFPDGAHGAARSSGEIELEPMVGKGRSAPQLVALAEPATRSGFVRKVYSILAVQLVATTFMASLVLRHGREWLATRPSFVMMALTTSCIMSLAIALVFSCCPDTMRRSPENYVLLALLTVAESVLVGFACLQYTVGSVLLCMGLTAVVVLGLTVYAWGTKQDLTSAGPYLLCCMLVLCGAGLFLTLGGSLGLSHSPLFNAMQVLYAACGALVFSVFIVHDTQLIMGGSHQHQFSIDDYAMAAITLYLDIIQMFLALLRLIGRQDDDGLDSQVEGQDDEPTPRGGFGCERARFKIALVVTR
eukprot:CAMPEP_0180692492 /NCGR_PEP_ID=MMETSP1038_2-20121128/848_1 /TAXON_ID=632150 /ORGANISM="Azadinium spinosum, Strain 3D9" /LENGTH=303 /DNA_ID=CAMNT_0022723655 /DNA_START=71 /DNA_END=980 /DNA_ORIENTATION=+